MPSLTLPYEQNGQDPDSPIPENRIIRDPSSLKQTNADEGADDETIPGLSLPHKTTSSNGLKASNSFHQLLEIKDVFYSLPNSENDIQRRKRSASPLGSERPTKRPRVDSTPSPIDPKPAIKFTPEDGVLPRSSLDDSSSINDQRNSTSFEYGIPAPSREALLESMANLGVPSKLYRDPYFANTQDVPDQPFEHGGRRFILKGAGLGSLEPWEDEDDDEIPPSSSPASVKSTESVDTDREPLESEGVYGWEYASMPPSRKETELWLKESKSQYLAELKRRQRQSQVRHLLAS